MSARLVVVTGTGTGIGKTHLAEALLRALGARGLRVAGLKPVESGVGQETTDAERLRAASSFHVEHSGIALAAPISPHLAARQVGRTIDPAAVAADIQAARRDVEVLLAELPGGLFTPLSDTALNADLAVRLAADFLLLVAPDRLGVLHDSLAATRAATAMSLRIDGLVLITPEQSDLSTGTNAAELARFLPIPVLPTVPRSAPSILAAHEAVNGLATAILR